MCYSADEDSLDGGGSVLLHAARMLYMFSATLERAKRLNFCQKLKTTAHRFKPAESLFKALPAHDQSVVHVTGSHE